jgi:flagella basal body P-ring formation protein FlgA
MTREQMRVDRAMILGRLAACGFAGRDIRFSGSQEVIVTLNEQEIDASRLVAAAAAMLNEKSPPAGEAQWRLSGEVEPISIPSGPAVRLAASLVTTAEDRATVRVDIVGDGKTRAGRDLSFTKAYLWRQVVARKDIAAGQAVTEAEAAIEKMYRPRPQQGWVSPYGKTATRAVPAGAVIAQDLLAAPRPAVVFERNAAVRVRVDLGGYAIMVKAVALSAGRVGETVPVQNIDSKRILTARVCPDGTVEPLLEENTK